MTAPSMRRQETWILCADDHVERICSALIHEERRFHVDPKPNGWWRIRAWFPSDPTSLDPNPLQNIEQATR